MLYWSIIESGLALIAASLPTLHSVIARLSLRAIWSRVRSAVSLKALRERYGSSPEKEEGYRETPSVSEDANTSYRDTREMANGPHDLRVDLDLESEPLSLVPKMARKNSTRVLRAQA